MSKKAVAGATAAAIAAAALAAFFPMLATDTACRYAPMAEAFAAGDWGEAFHPRFCVGMSVLAGSVVKLTGFDGYAACTFTATLAWALSAIPLFRLAERVFDRQTAWFAVVMYLICPQLLVWALKGLREPFKVLGVLLAADAVMRRRDGEKGWLSAAEAVLGIASLVLFKSDTILVAGCFTLVYAAYDGFRWKALCVAAGAAALLQPLCALVWAWTGYWLPAPHFIPFWQKLFGG